MIVERYTEFGLTVVPEPKRTKPLQCAGHYWRPTGCDGQIAGCHWRLARQCQDVTNRLFWTCLLFCGLFFSANKAVALDPISAGLDQIKDEAKQLMDIVESPMAKEFLRAADRLPAVKDRVLYRDEETRIYYSNKSRMKLDSNTRGLLSIRDVDSEFFYMTKYGTPMAYVRVVDLYAKIAGGSLAGKKVLDFGYGTIGQLRLMANCGAEAVGVDVDQLLPELYSDPGDVGIVKNPGGTDGEVRIINGRFPAIAEQVDGGYDLISSKNTLKNGFFHPERPVPANRLVDLGVTTEAFVKIIHDALKPGGVFLIYNICPAPSKPNKPYKHWADGRCPFSKEMLINAGFKVLNYNTNDDEATRRMAKTLEWDRGQYRMDLENDLFGSYTIARKK